MPPPPQEARFDRHFVRDLQWSRHQLEELAERRFMAAQMQAAARAAAARAGSPRAAARGALAGANGAGGAGADDAQLYSFAELFRAVRVEDFSSYISKLATPRELMLFMTGARAACGRVCGRPAAELWEEHRAVGWRSGLARAPWAPSTRPLPAPAPTPAPPAELLSRIEAHPDSQLSAQDLEIAVTKALEQAV